MYFAGASVEEFSQVIEVNLLGNKKPFKLPVILGMDLSELNIKMVIIAIVIDSFGSPYVRDLWKDELKTKDEQINVKRKEIAILKKKKRSYDSIDKQAQELREQETRLKAKLEVVKKVIKLKKNPEKIMHYVAKNIPEDVWLRDFNIENDVLAIRGYSQSYKSIGLFIDSLKSAIFFENRVKLQDSKTIMNEEDKSRLEQFHIKAEIVRYY